MPVSKRSQTTSHSDDDRKKYGEWYPQYALLSSTLQLAVPLWIEELRQFSWDYISQRAKQCADIVAEKGDIILFRSKTKGETARAFNHLAEGIACLAFVPGGVRVFGGHWEATLESDIPSRSASVLTGLLETILKALKQGETDAS